MAVGIFLQLPGIPGAAVERDHRGWIEVTSVSWGVEQTGDGGGAAVGKAKQRPLAVTAATSIATPLLFEGIAKGMQLATARLDVVRTGQPSMLIHRWEFADVRLASLDVAGADQGFADAFQLMSRRTRVSVMTQSPTGAAGQPVVRGWDFTANQPW